MMISIKNMIRHYGIFSKRLLCHKSFVAILLLVPILVCAVTLIAKNGDSGVITVALGMENGEENITQEIVSQLLEDDSLIRFVLCGSGEEAAACVQGGKADAAWIFHDGLEQKINDFAQNPLKYNAFVTVIQKEDNILLRLSHEKLNSVLYPALSLSLFSEYIENNLPRSEREHTESFYHAIHADGKDLFEFVYLNTSGAETAKEKHTGDFLISPLRGLLAITVVLGVMAAAMLYGQDEARGVFDRFSKSKETSLSLVYHAAASVLIGSAVYAALLLMRISVGWLYELLVLAVYCIAVIGFCLCLRLLLPDIRFFGAAMPVLAAAMTVFCPIFFPAPNLPVIQYLLPTYYYLNAFSHSDFVLYLGLYSILIHALVFFLRRFRHAIHVRHTGKEPD